VKLLSFTLLRETVKRKHKKEWKMCKIHEEKNCVITYDVNDYINSLVRIVHIICNHPYNMVSSVKLAGNSERRFGLRRSPITKVT
jgi:hypothetical protein